MTIRPQQETSYPPSTPQRRRWTPVKTTMLILGLVILVVIAGLAWWLASPLFIHNTSNATNPFAQSTPTTAASTPGTANTPVSGPVILATGKFIDTGSGDHGSGNVTIGKTADGKYVIHLDHLNVTNGPDLHVYLAPAANPTDPNQVKSSGVDLGLLSATEGSVNVAVPADVAMHLAKYHSVVIVCKTFSVIFTKAPLQFAPNS